MDWTKITRRENMDAKMEGENLPDEKWSWDRCCPVGFLLRDKQAKFWTADGGVRGCVPLALHT